MILPSQDECRRVIQALQDEPNLNEWELQFVDGNEWLKTFSDKQREVIARLKDKYDVK